MESTAAQNRHVATAHAMPTSVTVSTPTVFLISLTHLCVTMGRLLLST